jgi:hypothetical protein
MFTFHQKPFIVITGPSSTGKSTYAKENFPKNMIIESDGSLFEKLAHHGGRYTWDSAYARQNIYKEMASSAIQSSQLGQVVLVVDQEEELISLLKRENVELIVIGADLKQLITNVISRKNRSIGSVLLAYINHFKRASLSTPDEATILLKQSDMKLISQIKTTKLDNRKIELFSEHFFGVFGKKKEDAIRVEPIAKYDQFVIFTG